MISVDFDGYVKNVSWLKQNRFGDFGGYDKNVSWLKQNRFGDFGGYVKNVSWLKQTDLVISVVMSKTYRG